MNCTTFNESAGVNVSAGNESASSEIDDEFPSAGLRFLSNVAEELRLQLPSNRRFISPVLSLLKDLSRNAADFSDRDQAAICLALEEALVNAMVHGNLEVSSTLRDLEDDSFEREIAFRLQSSPYENRRVELIARFTESQVTFTIRDEGPGFEVDAVPDCTDIENLGLTHGRGLFLMRAFMDEVVHNDMGNQVTMVKRRRPSETP